MELVTSDDFYCYQNIWKNITEIFENHGVIRTAALFEAVKKTFAATLPQTSERAASMIAEWREFAAPAQIEEQCALLIESANKRKIDNLAVCLSSEKKSSEIIADAEAKIEAIRAALEEKRVDGVRTMIAECEKIFAGELTDLGWPQSRLMAETCCMSPNSMTVICGSPGASKSFYAMEAEWRWIFAEVPASSMQLEKGFHFHMRRAIAQISKTQGMTSNIWLSKNSERANNVFADYLPHMTRLEDQSAFQIPPKNTLPTRQFLIRWIKREIARGIKILIIDPITMMSCEGNRWIEEERFVLECAQICRENPIRLILVTHPKNGIPGQKVQPSLNHMQGSAAFSRFVDSVFWLDIHDTETAQFDGPFAEKYNRTMHFLKCKLGPGEGQRVGMFFDNDTLCCVERGKLA